MNVSDLESLPPELAARSISKLQIVLPLDEAARAVEHLTAAGRRLEAWEGWVQFADGGRTKSLRHPGSFVLPSDAARAARVGTESMRQAQAVWDRAPEYPGATLYFSLSFTTA
ncbi:MAG TPA: hypothetical protein VJU87_03145 [Gemmatimonadaceae bacterium]|nr:hypothetical protein [Gemmatimonadaceae bacterium]